MIEDSASRGERARSRSGVEGFQLAREMRQVLRKLEIRTLLEEARHAREAGEEAARKDAEEFEVGSWENFDEARTSAKTTVLKPEASHGVKTNI